MPKHRASRVDTVVRSAWRSDNDRLDDAQGPMAVASGTLVRCRGCRKLVRLSKAINIADKLPPNDPGGPWACRPCVGAAMRREDEERKDDG